MKELLKTLSNTILRTVKNWLAADPFTQSAATAYYAIFSLPGLILIITAFAALFFEQQQAEDAVLTHIQDTLGDDAANSVKAMVRASQTDGSNIWAFFAGGATLLFGASGLFVQLQRSLNQIWEVEVTKTAGLWAFIMARLLSFGLILAIGFLLLISLAMTAVVTVFGQWLATYFTPDIAIFMLTLNVGMSFLMTTFLFTLIFKILPDAHVAWREAMLGGAVSTMLFVAGEYALNYYLTAAQPQSVFGAAGSVILLMLWVSYSCMILLFGAEFAKSYAEEYYGHKAKAKKFAKKKI